MPRRSLTGPCGSPRLVTACTVALLACAACRPAGEGLTTAPPPPAGAAATAPAPTPAPAPAQPNIVFILTDDQAPNTTGFEGNRFIRTPNLDRMAGEGTYFSRAYVPLPQCAPSRAALLTGRYPHEIGAMSNNDAALPPDAKTIAHLLGGAGYRCGLIGKWHQGGPLKPQAGFEEYWVARDKNARDKSEKYQDPVIFVNGQTSEHKGHLTDRLTDYALRFIDQPDERGRPYFLWLAYYAPHEPFIAHPAHAYDPAQVPLPESIRDDLAAKPPQQRENVCHKWFQRTSEAGLRRQIADYYSMISGVDANVGRILDHLRQNAGGRPTLVIFMSDNGWFNGEHQLVRKGPMLYEELVRTPLLFWMPGTVPAGRRCAQLVSALDLFPTLAAVGGVTLAEKPSGYDIWPLARGAETDVRDAVFLQFYEKGSTAGVEPMLGIVTARFKYTRYMHGGDEELYDLEQDPLELRSQLDNPELLPTLRSLRMRIDQFRDGVARPFWES